MIQTLTFNHFLCPCTNSPGWTKTLDLEMARREFYHCAAAAGRKLFQLTVDVEPGDVGDGPDGVGRGAGERPAVLGLHPAANVIKLIFFVT
jgi:hypothetical protein